MAQTISTTASHTRIHIDRERSLPGIAATLVQQGPSSQNLARLTLDPKTGNPRTPAPQQTRNFRLSLTTDVSRRESEKLSRLDADAACGARTRPLFDPDLHVAIERREVGHQPLNRETFQLVARKRRYLWLSSIQQSSSLSLPMGFSDNGLPVGIQFATIPRGEALLLSLAYQFERALEWWRHRPAIWVGD